MLLSDLLSAGSTEARALRRALVVLLVVLSLAGVVVVRSGSVSGASGGRSAPVAAPVPKTSVVTTSWALLEAGADGRSVVIAYVAPMCRTGRPRIRVRETGARIRITVTQRVVIPVRPAHGRPGIGCLTIAGEPRRTVRLRASIAGRRLSGGGHVPGPIDYLTQPGPGTSADLLVPRLLGLAPRQALRALTLQGFHGRLVGGRGREVVAQQPPRGSTAPGGEVTLTVGR